MKYCQECENLYCEEQCPYCRYTEIQKQQNLEMAEKYKNFSQKMNPSLCKNPECRYFVDTGAPKSYCYICKESQVKHVPESVPYPTQYHCGRSRCHHCKWKNYGYEDLCKYQRMCQDVEDNDIKDGTFTLRRKK